MTVNSNNLLQQFTVSDIALFIKQQPIWRTISTLFTALIEGFGTLSIGSMVKP